MTRLHHFEITGENPAAVAEFYSSVFGWPKEAATFEDNYYLLDLQESGGPTVGVMDRTHRAQPVILWFDVPSIDATVAAILKAGGKTFANRHTIPDVGDLIHVADLEGTIFGLRQRV